MALSHSLTPLPDPEAEEIRDLVVNYWVSIDQNQELVGALGELVHETEAKVTELLQRNTVDAVHQAHRLTAKFEYRRQSLS